MRVKSAKALAMLAHLHRGMPYIYQGEELGMTNAGFTRLEQYRDLESINMYRQRVEEAKGESADDMMAALAAQSRDNARTPMQWDSTKYAGFTAEYAPAEPWIGVNPNHVTINAEAEVGDPNSVFAFYQRLIELRHTNDIVAAGDWQLLDAQDEQVYDFLRSLPGEDSQDAAARRRLLVVVNCSSRSAHVPPQAAALIDGRVDPSRIVISTTDPDMAAASLLVGKLSAWEGIVYQL